jgi:prolyl-tRNA editing enzyme YbaK/EbsC (Cys-tRNA(Pro) deacylase)
MPASSRWSDSESAVVWPEAVERVAAFLRAAGVEGRLEELLPGAGPPAGQMLRADGFDADGAAVVVLVPRDRAVDRRKFAAAANCPKVLPAPAAEFPFEGARVFMDQSALSFESVWLEAGSSRHLLGLSPAQLARVTNAETADLLKEARTGEVDDVPRG